MVEQGVDFSNWEASDICLDVLMQHHGPSLRQLGITIGTRDILGLFKDPSLVAAPAVVIFSCLWPPVSYHPCLDRLMRKYTGQNPGNTTVRALFYETMVFESVVGQLPNAMVICINRRTDSIQTSATPSYLAKLKQVPGYTPCQCNWPSQDPLRPLQNGSDLVVRMNNNGPFYPFLYEDDKQCFNLIDLLADATKCGHRVLFTAEWDGSLSNSCASLVRAKIASGYVPQALLLPPHRCRQPALRSMGKQIGPYTAYHEHAHDHRVSQVMDAHFEQVAADPEHVGDYAFPVDKVKAFEVNINAAVMWLFAFVVNPPA